jgi:periodic tryptophan protein 1
MLSCFFSFLFFFFLKGKVFTTQFCPDSPFQLAVAGSEGKVFIWDLSSNAGIRNSFKGRCNVPFSSDSTIIEVSMTKIYLNYYINLILIYCKFFEQQKKLKKPPVTLTPDENENDDDDNDDDDDDDMDDIEDDSGDDV